MILKSLENDDKEICSFFYPDMYDTNTEKGKVVEELKKVYEKDRQLVGRYEFYNLLEKCLIEVELNSNDKKKMEELDLEANLIKEIKGLAMLLSRFKPADWNKFLDVVIKWMDSAEEDVEPCCRSRNDDDWGTLTDNKFKRMNW